MATIHMTEADLVSNIADVMRQVRQGSEIVIEQGESTCRRDQTIAFGWPYDFGRD